MKINLALILFLFSINTSFAQNTRLNTYGNIGWYNYFGTFKLSPKWSIHTEYQWRRDRFITNWQQSLLRVGINYQLTPGVLCRVGYGWIETYPYGELPINIYGKDFTEHRLFQVVQLTHKENTIDISHRFMLEQRWVGRYTSAYVVEEDDFPLLHRMRYLMRLQAPFVGREITPRTPYFAAYNEVFIGFGHNVNANVFDQNRVGILAGYRFSNNFRLEAGYLNQVVQFGRQFNGQNIFQYNNGVIVNAMLQLDLIHRRI
jgi:hypothetical protein